MVKQLESNLMVTNVPIGSAVDGAEASGADVLFDDVALAHQATHGEELARRGIAGLARGRVPDARQHRDGPQRDRRVRFGGGEIS